MGSEPTSLYGLIALVITTIATTIVSIMVGKRGRAAGQDSDRIDEGVSAVAGWMQLTRGLTERVTSLEEESRKRTEVIEKLSKDLEFMHSWKRAAIRYILALRKHSIGHLPDEALPIPPMELMQDLREEERSDD